MRNKLIVVLNTENLSLGQVCNAIGHMMVGIALRIPQGKFPEIELYFSTKEHTYNFRKAAFQLYSTLTKQHSVFSDFAHTTTAGTAKDHAAQTKAIKESEINYFATCICAASDKLQPLYTLLHSESYESLVPPTLIQSDDSESTFFLEKSFDYLDTFSEENKKFSIVLADKLSTVDAIHVLIRICFLLAKSANLEALRLHQYVDADGHIHPGMSEHGLVILKAKNSKRLDELNGAIELHKLDSSTRINDSNGKLMAVAIFGNIGVVSSLTKVNINLWSGSFPQKLDSNFIKKVSEEIVKKTNIEDIPLKTILSYYALQYDDLKISDDVLKSKTLRNRVSTW